MSRVTFVEPMPGLPGLVDYELTPVDGAPGLLTLTTDPPGVRLFVVDAEVHVPGYAPTVAIEDVARLGLEDPADARVLVVAQPAGEDGVTVNLMAPVVVHRETGAAAQLIVTQEDWPLRHAVGDPLPAA